MKKVEKMCPPTLCQVIVFRVGKEIYMQFLSDQNNIYTKGDVNKYSSEV